MDFKSCTINRNIFEIRTTVVVRSSVTALKSKQCYVILAWYVSLLMLWQLAINYVSYQLKDYTPNYSEICCFIKSLSVTPNAEERGAGLESNRRFLMRGRWWNDKMNRTVRYKSKSWQSYLMIYKQTLSVKDDKSNNGDQNCCLNQTVKFSAAKLNIWQ